MRRPLSFGGAAAVAVAAASMTMGDFRAGQLSLFLSLAVLAVSLDLVWGYAGILSLGQLLPFGIAAYSTARLAAAAPSLTLPGLLLATLIGAAVAAGVGMAAFRRRPTPVVIGLLTLVLSLTLEQVAEQWRDVTGGFNGLTDVPRITAFGSEWSDSAQDLFISVLAVAVIAGVGLLVRRPIGAVLIGVRDNERRMEALGYDTVALRVWVFTVGGAVAGLAGALYVHRTGFVSPQIFGFALATNVVLWTLVGGRGTIIGPVVGSLAINFASATLADVWLQYWTLATGAIFVAAVTLVPEGLVPSLLRMAGRPARRSREPRLLATAPAAANGTAVFEAAAVDKSYGFFKVLDGVTLTMDEPELRCLIGPNGAGKSTLLDILCGQQDCQDGSITMLDQDCTGLKAWEFARHGVSRKFQSPQIIDSLSVAENIAVAAWGADPSPWRLSVTSWEARVPQASLRILERTGLDARLDSGAGGLSHGDKQWLEIAMAMAGNCRVLLLDEPTAGMTASESLAAAELLREVHTDYRLPVLIVEHDMAFIRAVADRVTVLARGSLIADGTVAEVESAPEMVAVYGGVGD
ncbi:MAG: ATP-binding cassette domain-containing protein [Acidimicrobiaceae bacterium]|nr:ATP-binding cassette domain-containing protein [Acidimicrobiaceae bacterium]MYL04225.1 ATP-binding cassette domain-containing protein [Acidimicrobiaceae bacterium]